MCGRVIQSSSPLRLAIVEGLDVSDSRMGQYSPALQCSAKPRAPDHSRELFGQAPLDQLQGHTVGRQLTEEIGRLEEVMIPLLERCHRMMARSITHLEGRRGKSTSTSVLVNQAGQVNVDCAVMNKAER
jgi:hypothetical protein